MSDDPEITDPRDPCKRPDIVTELDRWLVSRASLHEATVSHALLQGARDEIVALRASLEHHDRLVLSAVVAATPAIRVETLHKAAALTLSFANARHDAPDGDLRQMWCILMAEADKVEDGDE